MKNISKSILGNIITSINRSPLPLMLTTWIDGDSLLKIFETNYKISLESPPHYFLLFCLSSIIATPLITKDRGTAYWRADLSIGWFNESSTTGFSIRYGICVKAIYLKIWDLKIMNICFWFCEIRTCKCKGYLI